MFKKRKILAMILSIVLVASIICGCGQSSGNANSGSSNGEGTSDDSSSGVDISKKVELNVFTFAGANPKDMDMVNEAASKITEEKLNCTVNVQVMSDWSNRYNLALSSGEQIDLIWTAMWYSYQPYAFDGAWLNITSLIDEVAPELRDIIGMDTWENCRIEGNDYAIPTTKQSYSQWGVAWREDLRQKYGCDEINSWETMEAYAEAISANEAGMIPFCDSKSGGLFHSLSEKSGTFIGLGNPQFSYGVGVDPEDNELYVFHESDLFKDYLTTQRRWVENGYVQPDVASSTDSTADGMLSGKYAGGLDVIPANALTSIIMPAAQSNPDWEIGYMSYGEMFQWAYTDSPISMGFALPKACPNPERTLLFVKEMLTNNELYQLYDMGIEGVHYELDEEGYYVSLNDPLNPGYVQSSSGLTGLLFNNDAKIYSKDYQWVLDYHENNLKPYTITNYFQNFAEDYSSYSDKVTAMSEINTQFTWPLLRGAIADPLTELENVNSRLDAAGRQEVFENVKDQYAEYLKGLGVN